MALSRIAIAACTVASLASAVHADPSFDKRDDLPAGYNAAPYYPAPYGGWADEWRDSYAKAKKLVDSMTLAEKTNITAGTGIFMGKRHILLQATCRCNGNTGSALRVGFPQLCLNDAANGVRQTDNVTVFPDGITVGATFDKGLMHERGVAIGKEARGKGVNVWLGPTVGPIGRKPKGGRNWEGFGSDPVLQAVGARETIKGLQAQGVIATIKHLIGNEQEMHRQYIAGIQTGYSSNIDDRTLHELYLWPFAEGVRAGVGAVMTAYNAVNGSACSQNAYLINGLLKDELGFQGFVMSDWISHMSGVGSALAGLDMDMPGDTQIPLFGYSYWMFELSRAALNASVPMDRLNDMTTRIVATWYQMGQDKSYPPPNFHVGSKKAVDALYPGAFPESPTGVVNEFVQVQADHDVIARQIAQDAVTLLKNDDNTLPLSPSSVFKVYGTDAQANPDGPNACSDRACNKGTLGQGWGSGTVDFMYLDDPISAIKARASNVTFFNTDSIPLFHPTPGKDDIAIVFISSDSGENGYLVEGNEGDRSSAKLAAWHNGDGLVQDVAKRYSKVIVVAHTVGPLLFEKWIDLPSVKSVVIAHLPGQEAGKSLASVLFGDVSPNGHLPYSITKREEDMPASVTDLIPAVTLTQPQDTYTEGLYIDYRWLNKAGIKPRYAFGHGLSYTTFSYEATIQKKTPLTNVPPQRAPKAGILTYNQPIPGPEEATNPENFHKIFRYIYSWLRKDEADDAVKDAKTKKYPYPDGYSTTQKPGPRAGGGPGGNPALWDVAYTMSVKVTNTGSKFSGKASAQAYVQFPDGIKYETPIIQLRDFAKTKLLKPGESQTVELEFTRKDMSVWDAEIQDWVVPKIDGDYKIWVGSASDNTPVVCHTDGLKCASPASGPV